MKILITMINDKEYEYEVPEAELFNTASFEDWANCCMPVRGYFLISEKTMINASNIIDIKRLS